MSKVINWGRIGWVLFLALSSASFRACLALVAAAIFVGSCSRGPGSGQRVGVTPPAGSVPDVSPPAGYVPVPTPSVAEKLQELEGRLGALEAQQDRLDALESEQVVVHTEQEGYGVARTGFGSFTVISRGVEPYLDGYKVRLSIGNLTSATFHGVKLKATWGIGQSREFDLTTVFAPGSYAPVELILTPAKPEGIKRILVGLEFSQMSLRRHQ